MAVTKIRKISSWTLLATIVISAIVLVTFFAGGVEDPTVDMQKPIFTDLLLNWTYVIFGLTLICGIGFGIWQFIITLQTNTKGALIGFGAIVGFLIVMGIAYALGDGTPLPMINEDSAEFNTPRWLRITDMWIYTTYIMIFLIIVAVIAGNVRKIINK